MKTFMLRILINNNDIKLDCTRSSHTELDERHNILSLKFRTVKRLCVGTRAYPAKISNTHEAGVVQYNSVTVLEHRTMRLTVLCEALSQLISSFRANWTLLLRGSRKPAKTVLSRYEMLRARVLIYPTDSASSH